MHHLVVSVAPLAVVPPREHLLGVAHHDLAVGIDAFAVEGGLREATLPPPEIAVTRHEAVAEQELCAEARLIALFELAPGVQVSVFHVCRVAQEVDDAFADG